jgi:hypothetical protein
VKPATKSPKRPGEAPAVDAREAGYPPKAILIKHTPATSRLVPRHGE